MGYCYGQVRQVSVTLCLSLDIGSWWNNSNTNNENKIAKFIIIIIITIRC